MNLTPNQRIGWNVLATYGRSLYAMVLGLFTARWALSALGDVDFGLFGLVGGLTTFISFFNSLLAVSTSRFFAFAVGQRQASKKDESGLKECQAWFTSATLIHLFIGTVLIAIGYPIGLYAVRNYLVIPEARIISCESVWLMTCIMCFVGMFNVPFKAMYTAKQEIAEMTLYSVLTTTLNAAFLYYAATHDGDWLVLYAVFISLFTVIPQIVMGIRAFIKFEECRFIFVGISSFYRMKSMFSYSMAQFFADFAGMLSTQGTSIIINRILGPVANASLSIGNRVADHALSLGTAMIGAMSPAIVNAAGANDFPRMRYLSYLTCKFGTLAVLFFAIPLMLEAEEVLILWLKSPPEGASVLCSFVLASFIVNRLSSGLSLCVEALGRIAKFKITMGIAGLFPLILSFLFLRMGYGLKGVGWAGFLIMIPFTIIRLYFSCRLAGVSLRHWFFYVFAPVMLVWGIGTLASLPIVLWLPASFLRIIIVTVISTFAIGTTSWFFAFSSDERKYVASKISRVFIKKRI